MHQAPVEARHLIDPTDTLMLLLDHPMAGVPGAFRIYGTAARSAEYALRAIPPDAACQLRRFLNR
jgi:hypothetical protein